MEHHLTSAEPAPAAPLTAQLLGVALERGATVETLERLLALQERFQQQQAQCALNRALLEFKMAAPKIVKSASASIRPGVTYRHAVLSEIVDVLTPALARCGLSFYWQIRQEGGAVVVRCALRHVDGAEIDTEMAGQADTSGQKNAIQAIASTVTYLQRYTLLALTGLAAGEDDDGRGGAEPAITAEQARMLRDRLNDIGPDEEAPFLRWVGVERLEQMPAGRLEEAMAAIERKRRKVYGQ